MSNIPSAPPPITTEIIARAVKLSKGPATPEAMVISLIENARGDKIYDRIPQYAAYLPLIIQSLHRDWGLSSATLRLSYGSLSATQFSLLEPPQRAKQCLHTVVIPQFNQILGLLDKMLLFNKRLRGPLPLFPPCTFARDLRQEHAPLSRLNTLPTALIARILQFLPTTMLFNVGKSSTYLHHQTALRCSQEQTLRAEGIPFVINILEAQIPVERTFCTELTYLIQ